MTYTTERKRIGRLPFQMVRLALDYCTLQYGESPCVAGIESVGSIQAATSTTVTLETPPSIAVDDFYNNNYAIHIQSGTGAGQTRQVTDYVGSTGVATLANAWATIPDTSSQYAAIDKSKGCYNTFNNCQDQPNYTPDTTSNNIMLTEQGQDFPIDVLLQTGIAVAVPCIKTIKTTAPKIDIGKGLGIRGVVQISCLDFPHHDFGVDQNVRYRKYTPQDQGTFWGKLIARNPFYNSRKLTLYRGYLTADGSFNPSNFELQTFIITNMSGPLKNDSFMITAKDVLTLVDDRKSKCPKASTGELLLPVAIGDTTATLNPVGIGALEYPTSGKVRIGEEVIAFTRGVTGNTWVDLVYGNNMFVGVSSDGGSTQIVTSEDGGITWVLQSTPVTNTWTSIAFGNNLFVCVADSGTNNRVMTSTDGKNWVIQNNVVNNDWQALTFGNSLFVAVANTGVGNRVIYSADGVNWLSSSSAADLEWSAIVFGNTRFMAVAKTGTGNRVMYSADAITWVSATSANDFAWEAITYGTRFIAVASSGVSVRVMESVNDGVSWSARLAAADNDWQDLVHSGTIVVAVSNTGVKNRVMTSGDNGVNWTIRTTPDIDRNWSCVAHGGGKFVALATDQTEDSVMTSSDGINWTLGALTGVGDILTLTQRADSGTSESAHQAADTVQLCKVYTGLNLIDILTDLITNFTPILDRVPSAIDTVGWATEKDQWLTGNNLTTVITKPTGVKKLLEELTRENIFYMYWASVEQKLKIKAVVPESVGVTLDEDSNIIADTFSAKQDATQRLSQVWFFYGVRDFTEVDKEENYRHLFVKVDSAQETTFAFGDSQIEVIKSRWVPSAALAVQSAGRLVSIYGNNIYLADFTLDNKDEVNLGDLVNISSRHIQSTDGTQATFTAVVTGEESDNQGTTNKYKAQQFTFLGSSSFIHFSHTGFATFVGGGPTVDFTEVTLDTSVPDRTGPLTIPPIPGTLAPDIQVDGGFVWPDDWCLGFSIIINAAGATITGYDKDTKVVTFTPGIFNLNGTFKYVISPPSFKLSLLLLENGDFLKLENGDFIDLENSTAGGASQELRDKFIWIAPASGVFDDGTEAYTIF